MKSSCILDSNMPLELEKFLKEYNLQGITAIIGRVGLGKNDLAINIMKYLANKEKVLFISLDSIIDDIKVKCNCIERNYQYNLVKKLDDEYNICLNLFDFENTNIDIVDNIKDIKTLKDYLKKNKVSYVVIDYIELFDCNYEELKKLTTLYGCNIIFISNLGRKYEIEKANINNINKDIVDNSNQIIILNKNDESIDLSIYKNKKEIMHTEVIYNRNYCTFK